MQTSILEANNWSHSCGYKISRPLLLVSILLYASRLILLLLVSTCKRSNSGSTP